MTEVAPDKSSRVTLREVTRDNLRELYGIDVEIVELPNQRRICSPAIAGGPRERAPPA